MCLQKAGLSNHVLRWLEQSCFLSKASLLKLTGKADGKGLSDLQKLILLLWEHKKENVYLALNYPNKENLFNLLIFS